MGTYDEVLRTLLRTGFLANKAHLCRRCRQHTVDMCVFVTTASGAGALPFVVEERRGRWGVFLVADVPRVLLL